MLNFVQAQNMLAFCLFIKSFVGCMLIKKILEQAHICFAAILTYQNGKKYQNSILQGSGKCLSYA